jgi:hypothetical protein
MESPVPLERPDTPATQTGHRQDQESMANLSDEIKEFIVRGLARFDTPSQVAEAVKETFGIDVGRQQVYAYDPGGSRPPAERWVALHAATRAKFLEDVAGIGVAHKAVRLRMLERFAMRAEANNYPTRAAMFLEQAAKECGGAFESRKPRPSS